MFCRYKFYLIHSWDPDTYHHSGSELTWEQWQLRGGSTLSKAPNQSAQYRIQFQVTPKATDWISSFGLEFRWEINNCRKDIFREKCSNIGCQWTQWYLMLQRRKTNIRILFYYLSKLNIKRRWMNVRIDMYFIVCTCLIKSY